MSRLFKRNDLTTRYEEMQPIDWSQNKMLLHSYIFFLDPSQNLRATAYTKPRLFYLKATKRIQEVSEMGHANCNRQDDSSDWVCDVTSGPIPLPPSSSGSWGESVFSSGICRRIHKEQSCDLSLFVGKELFLMGDFVNEFNFNLKTYLNLKVNLIFVLFFS